MSKIICDICGTKYPDTADQCPICGYSNTAVVVDEPEESIPEVTEAKPRTKSKGGKFSKRNKRTDRRQKIEEIADDEELTEGETEENVEADEDYDLADIFSHEENDDEDDASEDDEDDEDDDDDEDEEEKKSSGKVGNILLSILLIIVIFALLCVSGFILAKYIMPQIKDAEDIVLPTESYVETAAPTETEEPTIPCAALNLSESNVELAEAGQMYLLNVDVQPADTTDTLTFVSSDENVATVNEEGRVTAVGEGMALITITCGDQTIYCNVTVVYPTEAPTEEPTEAPTEEPTEAPTEEPTEAPTEGPTEPAGEKAVIYGSAWVRIRQEPTTKSAEVGRYNEGDVVYILERRDVGGKIWGRTDKGWVSMNYVKLG